MLCVMHYAYKKIYKCICINKEFMNEKEFKKILNLMEQYQGENYAELHNQPLIELPKYTAGTRMPGAGKTGNYPNSDFDTEFIGEYIADEHCDND